MKEKSVEIAITSEFITLGQFLKFADVIQSGGEAKSYLQSHDIVINGEQDNRRGRKLRKGDKLLIEEVNYEII